MRAAVAGAAADVTPDGGGLAERLGSGGWTKGTVYPAASRLRPLVLGTTVLMASSSRIYARTEAL